MNWKDSSKQGALGLSGGVAEMRRCHRRSGLDFHAIQARAMKNIEVLASDLGIKLRNGRGACPFHGGDDPNLVVTNTKVFFCHKCHAKGDGVDTLRAGC